MLYFITFIEGIITFVSPCLLPMIPVYLAFIAGGEKDENKSSFPLAAAFVLGFTVVFMLLGALAGTLGSLLFRYQRIINIITGLIVILFGLSYLGLFSLPGFSRTQKGLSNSNFGVVKSFVFGMTFSIAWTPCLGTFLGSALMLASQQGQVLKGMTMLLAYSLGLGIPFLLSALFIQQLKSTFDKIKSNYDKITKISGIFLIILGLLMATGLLNRLLLLLT